VAEAGWAESQLNHDIWAHVVLSRRSCALTNNNSFWPSDKRSIQKFILLEIVIKHNLDFLYDKSPQENF